MIYCSLLFVLVAPSTAAAAAAFAVTTKKMMIGTHSQPASSVKQILPRLAGSQWQVVYLSSFFVIVGEVLLVVYSSYQQRRQGVGGSVVGVK